MPVRSSSGTFGPTLRPGSSTGVPHHVMLRGIERYSLALGTEGLAPNHLRPGLVPIGVKDVGVLD